MHHDIPAPASLICSCHATQSTPAQAVGCVKLPPRRAVTLAIRAPGQLRISHGRVWVTCGNADDTARARAGDHFLNAGEVLPLAWGQQVVMESMDAQSDSTAYFNWEPDVAALQAASPRHLQYARSEVRQPLLDLAAALHQVGWALGQLGHGVSRSLAYSLMPRRSSL